MEEEDKKLEKSSSDGKSTWLLWVIVIVSLALVVFLCWRFPDSFGRGLADFGNSMIQQAFQS